VREKGLFGSVVIPCEKSQVHVWTGLAYCGKNTLFDAVNIHYTLSIPTFMCGKKSRKFHTLFHKHKYLILSEE
jgi:hypothetical protein